MFNFKKHVFSLFVIGMLFISTAPMTALAEASPESVAASEAVAIEALAEAEGLSVAAVPTEVSTDEMTALENLNCFVQSVDAQIFTGSALMPKPVLYDNNGRMIEGVDYALSYKDNVDVGTASITITGRGAFSGKDTIEFTILPGDLGDVAMDVSSMLYSSKAGGYRAVPTLRDPVSGRTLVPGTDYNRELVYTYANGAQRGEKISATAVLPIGTAITVTVSAGDGTNYTGTCSALYRVVANSLANASVSVRIQSYTGLPVLPVLHQAMLLGSRDVIVKLNGRALNYGTDYYVQSTPELGDNDVNEGRHTLRIVGSGFYTGTYQLVNFKIS